MARTAKTPIPAFNAVGHKGIRAALKVREVCPGKPSKGNAKDAPGFKPLAAQIARHD